MGNEGLRIEFEYYSKEYEEEIEMELRPAGVRETTPILRTRSPRTRRQRRRVVEFEESPNRDGSRAPMSNHVHAYNGFMYPSNDPPNSYSFYTQPIDPLPNAPAYLNHGPTGLFIDSTGYVTVFVRWIENYPLPDGLKMPSHVVS
ncbi:hypothetical protein Tco_0389905 [Tanacetum coccineum]